MPFRILLSLCDSCRIQAMETVEGGSELPPHVRHFAQKHLGHNIRFVIEGEDFELIAPHYAINPEPGIFLEKKKDKDAFIKRLKELAKVLPNSFPKITLEESARLLSGQTPEGSQAAFEERRRRRE